MPMLLARPWFLAVVMRVELWVASPEPRRRSVYASRNLSRAPPSSLCDRLRRPWTEPVCRQVRQQSGSGEGSGQATARSMPQVQAWQE